MARSRKAAAEVDETSAEAPETLENTPVQTDETEVSSLSAPDETAPVDTGKEPVVIPLSKSPESSPVPEARSKESVEAMIREKLGRRTDETASDPFVPKSQLDSEVKDIATKSGFPLTRGTEIGARLLARSQRRI